LTQILKNDYIFTYQLANNIAKFKGGIMKKLYKISLAVMLLVLVPVVLAGCGGVSRSGNWRTFQLDTPAPTVSGVLTATAGTQTIQTVQRFQFADHSNRFGHTRQTNVIGVERITRTVITRTTTEGTTTDATETTVTYVLVSIAVHTDKIVTTAAPTTVTIVNGTTEAGENRYHAVPSWSVSYLVNTPTTTHPQAEQVATRFVSSFGRPAAGTTIAANRELQIDQNLVINFTVRDVQGEEQELSFTFALNRANFS